ncbi:MAG: phosphatidylserine decarboxylase family protein [Candidatus Marinimicrobia bacterium]|jgi:phosphatidylserine decarboxylase|nr:phosphatidylserine decarboxylase family protein [Candidatus Neomarinimicrobiota bacterium]MDP7094990.1 phosphatidylserine decarboxylase family protein [Candidatus Neomarinimicrobiota bacterium]MDP7512609.1 phosphatidylserine decarboxylase family protein [Candidatus Neomarinimicrobiota bacterium]|tara:strand:- start:1371 stop:2012 length:642 start_codon:yes stop_codon:yes gene_type:complete
MLAPEGRKILIGLMVLTFICGISGYGYENAALKVSYYVFGVLFIFSLNFFRDPQRTTPEGENLLIAPADGKVVLIDDIEDDAVGNAKQISIFLNVFNVHSNKMPVNGIVESVDYKKGKFKAAFNHSASDVNEQTIVVLSRGNMKIKIKQIAGLIARRIHCYAKVGSEVKPGERFGFIMFGSRTDLIVPFNSIVNVKVGDKVTGGKTIVGLISA